MARRIDEVIDFHGSGNNARARLCGFVTGQSNLLPAHEAWLKQYVVPLLRQPAPVSLHLMGYASKLGGADLNQRLSVERAKAVRHFLKQQVNTSTTIDVGGYGESRSTGAPNDNSPMFRAVDVYIYPTKTPPPPPTVPPVVDAAAPVYMGLGVKFGGIAAIAGYQTIEAMMYSSDQYQDSFNLEAQLGTLGLGLGGGLNAVLVLAFGAKQSYEFLNAKFEGWDFAVSLGGKWGDVAKGISKVPAFARLATAIKSAKGSAKALKAFTKLSPSEWERMSELSKTIMNAMGVDSTVTTPTVNAFDIPLAGVALELSVYKWWGRVTNIY